MKKLFLLLFLVTPWLLSAQDFQFSANFAATGSAGAHQLPSTLTFNQFQVTWTVLGTLTYCAVSIDTSSDGKTWTAGGLWSNVGCVINGPLGNVVLPGVSGKNYWTIPPGTYLRITANNLQCQGDVTVHNCGLNVTLNAWGVL